MAIVASTVPLPSLLPPRPTTPSREALLAAIVESSDEAITSLSPDGVVLSWNAAAESVYGWTAQEALGAKIDLVLAPGGDLQIADVFRRFERGERRIEIVAPRVRKDGASILVALTISPVRDANGRLCAASAIVRDVTRQRHEELEARESVQLVQEAQSLAHVGTYVTYLDGSKRMTWSKEARQLFELPDDREPTLELYLSRVHPDDLPRVKAMRRTLVDGDEPYDLEYRVLQSDGSCRWVRSHATVSRDPDGTPRRLLGVFQDITDQKRTLDRLRESEARYRRIIETTSEGVWTIDADARTTFVNARMAAMLGYAPSEMLGKTPLDFVREADRASVVAQIEQRRRGIGGQVEMPLVRKDGSLSWVLLEATPSFDDGRRYDGALAMVTDVSERRAAQQALMQSEHRFARLAECGIVSIAVADETGKVYEANDAYLALTGHTRDALLEGKVDWKTMTAPECVDMHHEIAEQLRTRGVMPPFEKDLVRKDGTRVPVLMGMAAIEDGKCIVFLADLTERKIAQSELKNREDQLRQAQKMEAIGQLAGGVAHDFNNLLCVILSNSDIILDELRPGDPLCDDIDEIKKAGERAAALTRQLLAFSRRQVLEPRILDLGETVVGMEKMLRRLIGEDVRLELHLASTLGKVNADPGQIEQVIMNLAVNARDAMPKGGKVTLETHDVDLATPATHAHGEIPAGRYVRLTVKDDGEGMDASTMARIFEPFFTTKEKDKGTGLGLSTVLGIVEQSGGHVTVSSEPGAGARFDVLLPRVTGEVEETIAPPMSERGREEAARTVLVVEDDEAVRALVTRVLERAGYCVLEAPNAGEALLTCEQHENAIDLLLTDVVLPRLSGPRVVERLKTLRPEMRVLYMSGYPDGAIAPFGVLEQGVALLHKPIRPGALLSKVRAALAAR